MNQYYYHFEDSRFGSKIGFRVNYIFFMLTKYLGKNEKQSIIITTVISTHP